MPNLVGQSLGSATEILQTAGMRLGTVKVSATTVAPNATGATTPASPSDATPSPSSLILSQDPAAGQKITAGSAINFEVSR
jgi:beta-lactam-binding protein with PASTA domain